MRKLFTTFFFGTLMGMLSAGCSLFGIGSEEQPNYKVLAKEGNKEIRQYDSYIIAKTTITGSFKNAQSKGFRILAGYIFGKNKAQQKIAMTAPVVISPPDNNTRTMTFSMPLKYNLETLPIPTDSRVKIEKVDGKIIAALTFSGFWNESSNAKKAQELTDWMISYKEYKLSSPPMFAGYNPPWTLPFLRRNEVLIELIKIESKSVY